VEYMKKKGYIFGKALGEGSFAKVHAVMTPKIHMLACKIISKENLQEDYLNKFLPRELDVLRRINHENVVSSVDIFEYTSKVFILTEMAENGDLLDYLEKKGNRPDAQAKRLFGDIVRGVSYLHSLNIAHRHLACEHLLLFKKNKVKIAGFGFSRFTVDNEGKQVLSETFCGSDGYAAPEILKGSKYDPKGYDMWQCGVVLFIIVCGSMPFDDSDRKELVKAHLKDDIHFPSRVKDSIDEDCKKLIRQLLELDVTRRLTIEQVRNSAWLSTQSESSRPLEQ